MQTLLQLSQRRSPSLIFCLLSSGACGTFGELLTGLFPLPVTNVSVLILGRNPLTNLDTCNKYHVLVSTFGSLVSHGGQLRKV